MVPTASRAPESSFTAVYTSTSLDQSYRRASCPKASGAVSFSVIRGYVQQAGGLAPTLRHRDKPDAPPFTHSSSACYLCLQPLPGHQDLLDSVRNRQPCTMQPCKRTRLAIVQAVREVSTTEAESVKTSIRLTMHRSTSPGKFSKSCHRSRLLHPCSC